MAESAALQLPPDVTSWMEAMNEVLFGRFQRSLRTNRDPVFPPTMWEPLNVANAAGGLVNLDYYAVRVRTPDGADPAVFLNQIRTNLNRFVDAGNSSFDPYPEVSGIDRNAARWSSTWPVGSFVTIDIPGNDGTAATIGAGPDHWTFATVQSPQDGLHPVSGNRQFGYTDNGDGTVTFYTRGVDRITDSGSTAINWASSAAGGSGVVLDGADALWRSFQQRVATYVRETGGQAQVLDPVTVRPDWSAVRDVLTGREAVRTFLNRQR